MVEFNVVVNDPETGNSYQVEVEGQHASTLVREEIGDQVDGMFVGLPGYTLEITGGSDGDGFPMRPEIPGAQRKKLLVSDSVGFDAERDGQRRKKTFRGREIGPDLVQINMRVVEAGPEPVEDHLGEEDE